MANKSSLQKIMSHPDRDEIINKLLLGIDPKDIHENLSIRYGDVGNRSLIISVKDLISFKNNSLDLYKTIQEDLQKTSAALATKQTEELQLSIKESIAYKDAMIKLANNELDIKTMLGNLILACEMRISQIHTLIQEHPEEINTKTERLYTEYMDRLQAGIERWQKYVIGTPDSVVQHNVSVQHIDTHIAVFYEAIKRVLSQMDIESSLLFMELFNEEMNKLKAPKDPSIQTPVEARLAEVKSINDQIQRQINQEDQ